MTDIVILDGARTAIGTFGRSPMLGALNCPFGSGHMGVTDENAAAGRGILREAHAVSAALAIETLP